MKREPTLPHEPAFATGDGAAYGLTKREYMAAQFAAAMCQGWTHPSSAGMAGHIAGQACDMADALIERLNAEEDAPEGKKPIPIPFQPTPRN